MPDKPSDKFIRHLLSEFCNFLPELMKEVREAKCKTKYYSTQLDMGDYIVEIVYNVKKIQCECIKFSISDGDNIDYWLINPYTKELRLLNRQETPTPCHIRRSSPE